MWDYLDLWEWDGTIERIHHVLYVAAREQAGREASPSTAIIDSQSAKSAQKGRLRSIRPAMMRARNWSAASATSCVARTGRWKLEIVRRCDRHRFVVLPKRWIVERTRVWISRNRRLARDYERQVASRTWLKLLWRASLAGAGYRVTRQDQCIEERAVRQACHPSTLRIVI